MIGKCSSVYESGVPLPNGDTLLVSFGLAADLRLRTAGLVGRSP